MKQPYVEIAVLESWAEADIIRNQLTARGVSAVLMGPNTSSTFGMYMGIASKVSVMVPQSSVRFAKEILAEAPSPGAARPATHCRSDPPRTPIRSPSRDRGKNNPKR